MDTGMGCDGYSVIEQGKVDFLTIAKPEDRKELFEGASGDSKV
jgi:chromosome segregation protein